MPAGTSSLCALTSTDELRCFGKGVGLGVVILPHTVQTGVGAIAPNTLCVKTKSGPLLCPVKNADLAQWSPSPLPWKMHEAWLDYGRALDDY